MNKKSLCVGSNLKFLHIFSNYGYIFEVKRLDLPPNTPKDEVYSWYRVNENDSYSGYGMPTKLKFVDSGKFDSGKNIRILEDDGTKNIFIFDDKELFIDNFKRSYKKIEKLPEVVIKKLIYL